jgi:putative ABC transport system ATP-binding protein
MAADTLFKNPGVGVAVRNVSKCYRIAAGDVHALRDSSWDVAKGSAVAIMGPSGCGKTTLLNLLGGVDRPSSGTILIEGQDVTAMNERALETHRLRRVGFVFQFFNLIPNLTARENVMVAAEISDNPMDVKEALRLVGLGDRADHFPAQLSGGEQQRVAIARALAKNPAVLLCDEPTGALDYDTGKRVLGLLHDVNHRLGKTVVLITHNLAISRMADRLVRMRSGEVVELKTNPEPASPDDISW